MKKYISRVGLLSFLFLLSSQKVFANILPIYPPNGSVIFESPVNFKWKNTYTENEYIYRHEYSFESYFELSMAKAGLLTTETLRGLQNRKIYYWRVRYHPKNTFVDTYDYVSDIFVFGLNKDIPEDILKKFVKEEEVIPEKKAPLDEEAVIPSIQEEEIVVGEQEENFPDIPPIDIPKILPKKKVLEEIQSEFVWNVSPSSKAVLGTSSKNEIVCKFKYLKKKTKKIFCDIPKLKLTIQSIYPFANEYSIIVNGELVSTFNIQIDEYVCNFSLFKPITWFRCEEKFLKSNILEISPAIFFEITKDENRVSILSYTQKGDTFSILAGHVKNREGIKMVQKYRIVNSQFNIYQEEKNEYLLTLIDYDLANNDGNKPFIFPFEKIIGVTQWYGYTEYQTPHTGIDFGAYKENVLAVADGEVISKGWDNYYGECLSGGNYIKVRQSNGMYVIYFHLEEIYVNTGDQVKEGTIIAKSGNSGAWNCQKLGYHLHFETRLNSSSSSHSNPVRYINTDWSNVPTVGYTKYPGRVSGENPHPER